MRFWDHSQYFQIIRCILEFIIFFFLFFCSFFMVLVFCHNFLLISACNWCYFLFEISGNQQHTQKQKTKQFWLVTRCLLDQQKSISYGISHSKVTGRIKLFFSFSFSRKLYSTCSALCQSEFQNRSQRTSFLCLTRAQIL